MSLIEAPDYAKEFDATLGEYEKAKEKYLKLSGSVFSGFSAVFRGNYEASPSLDLLNATSSAKAQWDELRNKLHDIAKKGAKSSG